MHNNADPFDIPNYALGGGTTAKCGPFYRQQLSATLIAATGCSCAHCDNCYVKRGMDDMSEKKDCIGQVFCVAEVKESTVSRYHHWVRTNKTVHAIDRRHQCYHPMEFKVVISNEHPGMRVILFNNTI